MAAAVVGVRHDGVVVRLHGLPERVAALRQDVRAVHYRERAAGAQEPRGFAYRSSGAIQWKAVNEQYGGPALPHLVPLRIAGRPYTGPKDLKGMKIGVTAPGSSTHFMVLYMMAQAGLKPDDALFIGTGSGGTVVAAVQHGEVDGISNADPMVTKLDSEGLIKIVADTRTLEGTTKVYGGPIRPRCSTRRPRSSRRTPTPRRRW